MAKKISEKKLVYAIAKRHGVPGWLLWGIYGAESTFGTNGSNYFGLIEPSYHMHNGKTRTPKNTADLTESADIAAELLASLKEEHGSWAGAVAQYAPYDISHPRELSRQGGNGKAVFADAPFHLPLPGPLDPGNIWEEAEGLAGTIGGLFGGGGGGLPGKAGEIESGLNSIVNIAGFFKGVGELLLTPEGWLRLTKLIGGGVCVLWGLRIVIRESTGSDPVKTITKATETAAAVATIK